MGEAIQTIKAADAGIEGIIDLIDTMKGIAKDAYSADATEAASLDSQFEDMTDQISAMAGDASYGGMNLLASAPSPCSTRPWPPCGPSRRPCRQT